MPCIETFKTRSTFFLQMYNIHGLCNGHYVRCYFTTVHIDFEVATVLREANLLATIKCCIFHLWPKHGGRRSKLSGLVLITKKTRVETTEVEDCFTEDIMPENYVTLTQSLLQTCAMVFPQKRRKLIMAQNRFTLTLTNSSMHLIQPFSY